MPTYNDEKLATSSLILADEMNTVSSREIGAGSCVIGNTHICPRVSPNAATPVNFKRGQMLNFWMQVYNLGIDDTTKSNYATVTYQISQAATGMVILEKQLESKDLGAHSDQLTVEKSLPMAGLEPGKYKVTIKVRRHNLKTRDCAIGAFCRGIVWTKRIRVIGRKIRRPAQVGIANVFAR